jgi:glutamate synthase domain-containing protein 2
MAAGKYLEDDLDIAVESGVDYIAIDGCEAGTRGSAPILQDDFGLPTLFALIRADNYFRKHNLKGKISLIVSGGLVNPGHYLKALALGADAVYIGTIALFAMAHTEVLKALPWEPPPDVVWYKGKASHKLNVNKGAQNISKYLLSCNHEMKDGIIALGKRSIQQLDKEDLFALDHYTSEIVGIPVGYKEIHY